jgi:addiction module HigA family antidote
MSKVLIPAEVLKKELDSLNISVAKFAEDVKISRSAAQQMISGKLPISPEKALRLGKYFGKEKDAKYWANLATAYQLSQLEADPKVKEALAAISKAKKVEVKPLKAKAKKTKAASAKAPAKKTGTRKGRKPKALSVNTEVL